MVQNILQDVEGGVTSAESAFSAMDQGDPAVPSATSLTLDELRSKAADPGHSSNATVPSHAAAEESRPLPSSPGPVRAPAASHASSAAAPATASLQSSAAHLPSEADLVAAADRSRRLGSQDRVSLSPSTQPESADGIVGDEKTHRAASKAFMDSIASNVQASSAPNTNSSEARPSFGGPTSDDVVSLDDIIADIQQQEAAEASATHADIHVSDSAASSASSISQAHLGNPGFDHQSQDDTALPARSPSADEAQTDRVERANQIQPDPGMSREYQASTASAAAARVSEEAIPGTPAGQSREFQATSATADTSSADSSTGTGSPLETTVNGFQVLSRSQWGVPDQPPASAPGSQHQGTSLLDQYDALSGASGSANLGSPTASDSGLSGSTGDASQSREAQATTQAAASTRVSTEPTPSTPSGQSRDFQAESAVASSSPAASSSPEPVIHADDRAAGVLGDMSSGVDLGQSREAQAASQSAAAFLKVHGDAPATGASGSSNTANGNAGDAVENVGLRVDAGQSREAQAATVSHSSNEAGLPISARQNKAVPVSPSVTGRSQQKPFREPSPLPASFKLRPSSQAAPSAASTGTSASQPPSAPGTAGSSHGGNGGSGSSSPMKDLAASSGKVPGPSPYERRRGSRSKDATGAIPGAAKYPSGTGFGGGGGSSSSLGASEAADSQQPRVTSRRFGSNVWDPNQPDFVGFPNEDRVVRGGEETRVFMSALQFVWRMVLLKRH